MKRMLVNLCFTVVFVWSVQAAPLLPLGSSAEPVQSSSIAVNGFFSVDPANQGSSFRGAIVMEIPSGIHVNSNRPLGKYAIPTVVKIDAPHGLRVTPVAFPRGIVRTFDFGSGPAEKLAVFEDRAIMRFGVTVAPDAPIGVARVRVNVRFQSCTDNVCFPPATRELSLAIAIVGPSDPIKHINSQYFTGSRGKKR